MVGVFLLLITLAYGLTGYLLPWDNRAYWGTVVTTQIRRHRSGAGPLCEPSAGQHRRYRRRDFRALLRAARFDAAARSRCCLIVLHIYLVRRHGVAPVPGDECRRKKSFFPEQVFKDTVAVFIVFVILFVMAIVVRVPLERMADPTDTSYIPRPEWYFLFLFQMLKVFNGPLEVVGTVGAAHASRSSR